MPTIHSALLFDMGAYSATVAHEKFLSFIYLFKLAAVKHFASLDAIVRDGPNE